MTAPTATTSAVLFIDNGSHYVRALYREATSSLSPSSSSTLRYVEGCNGYGIAAEGGGAELWGEVLERPRTYGLATIRRPTSGGFISDAVLQEVVWRRVVLGPLDVDPTATDLVLTVPRSPPDDVAAAIEELVFRRCGFRSVTFVTAAALAMLGAHQYKQDTTNIAPQESIRKPPRPPLTGIVVDVGHRGTTVVPMIAGRSIDWNTVVLPVGGYTLQEALRRQLAFTQIDLGPADERLCAAIFEACCYCAPSALPADNAHAESTTAHESTALGPAYARAAAPFALWARLPPSRRRAIVAERRQRRKRLRGDGDDGEGDDAEAEGSGPGLASLPPPIIRYAMPTAPSTQPFGRRLDSTRRAVSDARREGLQLLQLGHEALAIPEALFHPPNQAGGGGASAAGPSAGIVEVLVHGLWADPARKATPLFAAPMALRQALLSQVVVCGGTGTCLRGFADRLGSEIAPYAAVAAERSSASPLTISPAIPNGGMFARLPPSGRIDPHSAEGLEASGPSLAARGVLAAVFADPAQAALLQPPCGGASGGTGDHLVGGPSTVVGRARARDAVRVALLRMP